MHRPMLALLCALITSSTSASEFVAPKSKMGDAMLSMMDAMGMINRDSYDGFSSDSYGTGNFDGFPYDGTSNLGSFPYGGLGGFPYSGMGNFPSLPYPTPGGLWNLPNGQQSPYYGRRRPASPLDGRWEGTSGEHLFIQGNRFRIVAADGRQADGMIKIHDNLVALSAQASRQTSVYEFAYREGRLVLRDQDGNFLLYRRLRRRR